MESDQFPFVRRLRLLLVACQLETKEVPFFEQKQFGAAMIRIVLDWLECNRIVLDKEGR